MLNCKSFLVTEAERKLVRRCAQFQQHGDASCHQVFFPTRQNTEGNSHHSDRNIRETCTIVCHCQNRVVQFQRGDAPHPGQPNTVTTPEIIDQIHELILEDRRISAKSIAEQLGISHDQVGSIIHEGSDMQKLSAKWVSICLNVDQKHQWCQSSEQLLEFFQHDPNDFLWQLVTMDKIWLYHYDLETKQQSVEWRHSGSPRPKKFRVQKSAGKVLASIFWDQDVILLIDYLPKGQTLNAKYYSSLLVQLKNILNEKHCRKATKGVLFLHDSAPAHWALASQKKQAYLGFHCLDHLPYSPDLAPSDYHLFPGLK